jgi:hypothetical protein
MALPRELAVKRAGAMLAMFAGNREADAMAPQVPSHRPAAVGLSAHAPARPPLRAPRPRALHSTLGHQGKQAFRLVALPRREPEGDRLTVAFGPHMDVGADATLAAS